MKEVKEDYSLDAMLFSHLISAEWLAWFLLATSVLFSSALPTSVLTFKKESGPGYWVPHQ